MFGTFDRSVRILLPTVAAFLLAGCQRTDFQLASGLPPVVAQTLASNLQTVSLQVDSNMVGSGAALHALLAGQADLAIIQNDLVAPPAPTDAHALTSIRTVHHLFSGYLLVIHRPDISAHSLAELLQGRRVGLNTHNSATDLLFQQLTAHFQIDSTSFRTVYVNSSKVGPVRLGQDYDVYVMIGTLPNPSLAQTLRSTGGVIFSLDEPMYQGMGDALEGLAQKNSLVRAARLARFAFGPEPTEPVQTLEVDFTLVSRDDVPADRIYALVADLHQSRELMARGMPAFRQVAQPVNEASLQFPLHEGTLQYLNRDRPTFWQENAEVIALLITLLTLGYTGLQQLARQRRKRALHRMEYWYAQILQLEREAQDASPRELPNLYQQLLTIRRDALGELQDEQLLADDAFLIFLRLHGQVRDELEKRMASA